MTPIQQEIAQLIIDAVNLEITVNEIDPAAPIFKEGLGLDSIDALEISVELSKRYGVQIKTGDANIEQIFASIEALAEYVATHQSH
jgi:acyl carrier protein